MKNILLSSAAVFAFAGAAAADGHIGVSFSGFAELGYNNDDDSYDVGGTGDNDGFYSDLDITANLAVELDNGLTAAASINLDNLDENGSDTNQGQDYELSLTNDMAGLYYGDTNFAAQNMWVSAGDMEGDNFSEADGEEAIRGEVMYGGIEAQMSYVLANNAGTRVGTVRADEDDLDQLSIGVAGDFGMFNIVAAYQEQSEVPAGAYSAGAPAGFGDNGDFVEDEVFGISAGVAFAGADVRVAYAENNNDESIGVSVSYPFGPVTATAYYVSEDSDGGDDDDNYGLTLVYSDGPVAVTFDYDDDQGTDKYGLEGSYDLGNGLTAFAGYLVENPEDGTDLDDRYYVAGTYDLGSGAELLVSYAMDDDDVDGDEIGAGEYQRGTTVEVSFEF